MKRVVRSISTRFDTWAAQAIGTLPKFLYTPSVWLGRLTSPVFWVSYVLLIDIALFEPGTISMQTILVVILIPLASFIKLFFRRRRPPTVYVDNMRIKSYSFPSSHAYSSMLAGLYLATISFARDQWWGVVVLFVAVGVGVSRVFVGAHYPSDVVAGWVLAGLALASVLMLG